MTLAATFLPEFEHELAGVRRTLERIPADRFGYRPHPKSFTAGELASHLANVPSWVKGTLTTTELDFASAEVQAMKPQPCHTTQELLDMFDEGMAEAREAISRSSDADLAVVWSGKHEGTTLFALPRMAVLRAYILNHAIHHRGQLTVYLRLMELPVPALYGPSADEA